MNDRLLMGLIFWEMFALALALSLYLLSVPEGMTPRGGLFWGVFLSISLFGAAMFFLIKGFIEYARRDEE